MKNPKIVIILASCCVIIACVSAPQGTSDDGKSFSGVYNDAWKYLKYIKKDLEDHAGSRRRVYTFVNEGVTTGSDNTDISISLTRSRWQDVLKIIDNNKGPVLYFVYSDIDLTANPFSVDPQAELLFESFSTRMNDYGLSNNSFNTLKNMFQDVAWKDN